MGRPGTPTQDRHRARNDPRAYTRVVSSGFTHLDGQGNARMVNVTGKEPTRRRAVARCTVRAGAADLRALEPGGSAHEAIEAARWAGVQAAKATSDLIPLCLPLPLGNVSVEVSVGDGSVSIAAVTETFERTGVEMEALTACAVAALTVMGACGSDGSPPVLEGLALFEKTGGRSGTWRRG